MTEKSYDQLVEFILQNQEHFYRLAYLNIDDQELAMDLVEKSIKRALDICDTFHSSKKICFYQILVNECRNMECSTNRLTDVQNDKIQQIRQLDFNHRMVLVLYYFEEFSLEETAQIMQISPDMVKTCLSDLLKIL
ncbi:MAG: sigma-70 family RNA polymerase sigma factor [Lachnospiraceae bacterium]|nr:sigma-70 family RNA polymerase sigma factor [Lachnospiraceae bacterium]